MSVDFQEIPGEWAVPGSYTEVSYVSAPGSLSGMPLRAVIIGQTGIKEQENVLHEYVTIGQAEQLYGKGSILAQAVRTFLTEKPTLSVDVIGAALTDNPKVSSGSFKFTGTATAAATAALYLGGIRFSCGIDAGATPEDIVLALGQAITTHSDFELLGLTLSRTDDAKDTLVITSIETGIMTSYIDIRYSSATSDQIPGVTVEVVGMNGGGGSININPALAALGETWYTDVILCQMERDAVSILVAEAKRRSDAMVAKDMRIYLGGRCTQGVALELQAVFSTSEELIFLPLESPRCSPWQIGAALGAQVAQSLNNDPARQLRTLPLNTLANLGPETADQFSDTQRSVLLQNGCSTVKIQRDGTMALERVVTLRNTDPKTGQSVGIWDVMIPAIAARVRYEWNSYVNATYARAKLADDDSPLANADGVVTSKTLKASWIAQCLLYQNQGWVDDVATLGAQARFERNVEDRSRVDSSLPIKPMGSLVVLANALQLQV